MSYSYFTLIDYMIAIFETKIKQLRNIHIKKKLETQADFLKFT